MRIEKSVQGRGVGGFLRREGGSWSPRAITSEEGVEGGMRKKKKAGGMEALTRAEKKADKKNKRVTRGRKRSGRKRHVRR